MDCMPGFHDDKHFSPGGVELSSATLAFSEINGVGLCCAWEVLMLRPIESLLLLQLGCMIKCHLSDHPLSPTYRLLSVSHCVSVCYSGSVPCFPCYLILFSTLVYFHFIFPPFILLCVLYSAVSFPLLFSAWLYDFATLSSCLRSIPSPPLVSPSL